MVFERLILWTSFLASLGFIIYIFYVMVNDIRKKPRRTVNKKRKNEVAMKGGVSKTTVVAMISQGENSHATMGLTIKTNSDTHKTLYHSEPVSAADN
jgi:hypothetical protein